MIQVTILLVRWQHWGDRSSGAALLLPMQPSSGAADPAPAAPDPAALNGTAMAAVAIPMYAAAAGNASAPIAAWPLRAAPGAQAHAVAYPRLHVLVLAFSIFASLVTAMQTAVMLAATNEDSAWKSRVMRSWTTFMLSCAFFFCDSMKTQNDVKRILRDQGRFGKQGWRGSSFYFPLGRIELLANGDVKLTNESVEERRCLKQGTATDVVDGVKGCLQVRKKPWRKRCSRVTYSFRKGASGWKRNSIAWIKRMRCP